MRVLTWNLKHGRAVPSAGRYLLDEFASALGAWSWDIALLQEVPPWWPSELAAAAGPDCEWRRVLTSRNGLLALRRAIAVRRPDLIKSNGGGANAILVRGGLRVTEHRTRRVRLWPERRWVHAVRLEASDGPIWAGNLHLQGTAEEAASAARAMLAWSDGSRAVLGGDFNISPLSLEGLRLAGGNGVDLVFAVAPLGPGRVEVLERGHLSDHAPVSVELGS